MSLRQQHKALAVSNPVNELAYLHCVTRFKVSAIPRQQTTVILVSRKDANNSQFYERMCEVATTGVGLVQAGEPRAHPGARPTQNCCRFLRGPLRMAFSQPAQCGSLGHQISFREHGKPSFQS